MAISASHCIFVAATVAAASFAPSATRCTSMARLLIATLLVLASSSDAFSIGQPRPMRASRADVVATVSSWYDRGIRLTPVGGAMNKMVAPLDEERWGGERLGRGHQRTIPVISRPPIGQLACTGHWGWPCPITPTLLRIADAPAAVASKSTNGTSDVSPAMIGGGVLALAAAAYFFTQQQ